MITLRRLALAVALAALSPIASAQTVTPYMGLQLPIPGTTTGPTWATMLNTALAAVDGHNHSPGYGAQIPTSGLALNADLPFNNYNLTLVRAARFKDAGGSLTGAADLGELYVGNGNLYYNNGSGQAIQITSGAGLNAASIGGIGGDYTTSGASVFYTSSANYYTFQGTTSGSHGGIASGELSLYLATGTPNITLTPPPGLLSTYTLTLPLTLPVSTQIVTIDATGAIAAALAPDNSTLQMSGGVLSVKPLGITASQIANATVTGAKIASATVTGSNLAGATVTGSNLASATVTGANIASQTITAGNVANGTLTTTQMSASANIAGSQLSSTAGITGGQIASATITGANIAPTTITNAKQTFGTPSAMTDVAILSTLQNLPVWQGWVQIISGAPNFLGSGTATSTYGFSPIAQALGATPSVSLSINSSVALEFSFSGISGQVAGQGLMACTAHSADQYATNVRYVWEMPRYSTYSPAGTMTLSGTWSGYQYLNAYVLNTAGSSLVTLSSANLYYIFVSCSMAN